MLKDLFYRLAGRINYDKSLNLKQNIQIGVAKEAKRKPRFLITVIVTAAVFVSFFVTGNLTPLSAAQPEPEDYPNPGVQFTFLGDVMLGRNIKSLSQKNDDGYSELYKNVKTVWKNSDVVFANFESAVLTKQSYQKYKIEKNVDLYSSKKAVRSVKKAGIDAISFANNHSCDYGKSAFLSAAEYFDSIGLFYSGVTDTKAYEATRSLPLEDESRYCPYTVIESNGKSVGFIAVTDVFMKRTNRFGLLTTGNQYLNFYINESSKVNDYTVVYVHWGEEYAMGVTKRQRELAHSFIDSGADFVVGSHPHVLQDVERYKKGVVLYSLGNLIMDQELTATRDGVICQYTEKDDGSRMLTLTPIRINAGKPYLTENSYYLKRIKKSLTGSLSEDSYTVDEKGIIHIEL